MTLLALSEIPHPPSSNFRTGEVGASLWLAGAGGGSAELVGAGVVR